MTAPFSLAVLREALPVASWSAPADGPAPVVSHPEAHMATSLQERCHTVARQIIGALEKYPPLPEECFHMAVYRQFRQQVERLPQAIELNDMQLPIAVQQDFYRAQLKADRLQDCEKGVHYFLSHFSCPPEVLQKLRSIRSELDKLKDQCAHDSCIDWNVFPRGALHSWRRLLEEESDWIVPSLCDHVKEIPCNEREHLYLTQLICEEGKEVCQHRWKALLDEVVLKRARIPFPPHTKRCFVIPATETKSHKEKLFSFAFRLQELGKGTYKSVHLIEIYSSTEEAKPPKRVAFSLPLSVERARERDFQGEADISKKLRESGLPSILKVKKVDYIVDGCRNRGLFSEYCTEGTLQRFVERKPSLENRMLVALRLCRSLQALHQAGFCHLDLNKNNVYVTLQEGQLGSRLADLATVCQEGDETWHCSTLPAPEMYENSNKCVIAHRSMDLWVLGELLLQCKHGLSWLSGRMHHAVELESFSIQATEAAHDVQHLIEQKRQPDEVDLLIIQLFSKEPERRPTAGCVAEAIERWLQRSL